MQRGLIIFKMQVICQKHSILSKEITLIRNCYYLFLLRNMIGSHVCKYACDIRCTVTPLNHFHDFCRHENLEVVKGDVFDADSITPILEGKNAVVSCLGFQVGAKTLYSKSITSIITAAER